MKGLGGPGVLLNAPEETPNPASSSAAHPVGSSLHFGPFFSGTLNPQPSTLNPAP